MTTQEIADARQQFLALPDDDVPTPKVRKKVILKTDRRKRNERSLSSIQAIMVRGILNGKRPIDSCAQAGYARTNGSTEMGRARKTFNARTDAHLIVILFQLGYIDPTFTIVKERL